jgi:hypothetical protein
MGAFGPQGAKCARCREKRRRIEPENEVRGVARALGLVPVPGESPVGGGRRAEPAASSAWHDVCLLEC